MAKRLKHFDPPKAKGGRKPTYPWSMWLNGETWKLKHGEDFACSLRTMSKFIRHTAQRRGILVSVFSLGEFLVITPRGDNHRAAG